jgi:hypothetical protein
VAGAYAGVSAATWGLGLVAGPARALVGKVAAAAGMWLGAVDLGRPCVLGARASGLASRAASHSASEIVVVAAVAVAVVVVVVVEVAGAVG